MSNIKQDCDIQTIGIGKVMSAGVLILASGTKEVERLDVTVELPQCYQRTPRFVPKYRE